MKDILKSAKRRGHSHATLEYYYQHSEIQPIETSENRLIFRALLPFFGQEEYNVYRLFTISVYKNGITMEIEVEHILAVRTKNNYIIAPEACIGSAPMICDSNISYNKRFICERSVIAGNEISKKNCKFTAKKRKRPKRQS